MLLKLLPNDFADVYKGVYEVEGEYKKIIRAADKISALIKCIEEGKSGNSEFASAEKATRASLEKMDCPEANYFMKEFLPAFLETIDENSL